jgi:hypothetical protein
VTNGREREKKERKMVVNALSNAQKWLKTA